MLNENIDKIDSFNIDYLDRFYNTVVIGSKRLCIKDNFFAFFVNESLKLRNTASTFFVSSKDELYMIYSLAKKMKRRLIVLSPSLLPFSEDDSVDSLDLLNLYIDYASYISNNYIVIVDVEYMKDKNLSDKFVRAVLSLIEKSMINITKTELKEHNIYFDDAHLYVNYVDDLIYYGREYNTSLFFFIRQYINSRQEGELKYIINNSINKIILDSASMDDKLFLLGNDELNQESLALIANDRKVFCSLNFLNKEFTDEFFNIEEKDIKNIKKSLEKKKLKAESDLKKIVESINIQKDLSVDKINVVEDNKSCNGKKLNKGILNQASGNEVVKDVVSNEPINSFEVSKGENDDIDKRRKNLLAINNNREELDLYFVDVDEDGDMFE